MFREFEYVSQYPPGDGCDSEEDDKVSVIEEFLQSASVRYDPSCCKKYKYQVRRNYDQIGVVFKETENVSMKECIQGSLSAAERTVIACKCLQETFQLEFHRYDLMVLPSSSVNLPSTIMMKSISVHTPQPPNVRS